MFLHVDNALSFCLVEVSAEHISIHHTEIIVSDISKDKSKKILQDSVPTIDISAISHKSSEKDRHNLAQIFENVYTDIGFAYIVGHGISLLDTNNIFNQAKFFHELPEEEKLSIKQNVSARGYVPLGHSTLKISTLGSAVNANQSAGFIVGPEVLGTEKNKHLLAGPNQWPSNTLLPTFKDIVMDYNQKLTHLMQNLIRIFSWVVCRDYYKLEHYFYKPNTYLRLQYYPPQPSIIPSHQYGISPHTDYGALTLLAQDDVGGLQLKHPNGAWIDAPPKPGAFILNTGDMMRRISNNRLIATPHRVINISGKKRYSIPFFFDPSLDAQITPIVNRQESPLYEPVIYGDYLLERVQNNYKI